MPLSDRDLLDRYLASRDDGAFRLLVERHLPLVHGVARRVTRNEEMARDVSQRTMIRLAERAALAPRSGSLAAWLHRIAHHLAVDLVRSEDRRRRREFTASVHSAAMEDVPEISWQELAPLLDDLVERLPAIDREVILLRFYCNEPHASVALQLGLSEETARKRSLRALEKLRVLLGKRGIAATSSVLATLLPAHAATPVPPALMTAVLSGVQGGAPILPGGLHAAIHAMNTTQKALVATAVAVFLVSAAYSLRPEESVPKSGNHMAATPASDSRVAPESRPRSLRQLPVDAGERLERLREILAIPGHVTRSREMIGFLDSLSSGQFTEVAEDLKQLNALNSDLMILFGSEWSKLDPASAATWALKDGNSLRRAVLKEWGTAEPQTAIAWVLEHAPTAINGERDANYGNPLMEVLHGAVMSDPVGVAPFLESISEPNGVKLFASELAYALSGETGEGLDRLLAALKPGSFHSELIARSMIYMTQNGQGEHALDLLLSDEAALKITPLDQFFGGWSRNRRSDLRAYLDKMPDGPVKDQAVISFCTTAYNGDVVEALELMQRHPQAATDVNIAKIVDNCPLEHSALALEQILRMKTPEARNELLTRRLIWWRNLDAAAAVLWMDSHEVPEAVKETVGKTPITQP